MDVRAFRSSRFAADPSLKGHAFSTSNYWQAIYSIKELKNSRQLPHVACLADSSDTGSSTKTSSCSSSSSSSYDGGGDRSSAAAPGLESFKALIANKRFICTQCGKCCTGDGEVWISAEEASAIAKHLNLPLRRFLALHARSYSKKVGWFMLRSNMESQARECTFLRPDNTCAIHPVRPLQCSTYPWWPELMDSQEWAWEKANICEGFDHPEAAETDLEDAARQLKLATAQEYQKMLAMKPPSKKQQALETPNAPSSMSNVDSSNMSTGAAQQQEYSIDRAAQKDMAWQLKLRLLQDQLDAEDAEEAQADEAADAAR